eukprot:scaffold312515_cov18-Prasinocladus_malaysianus.AAC.1
MNIRKENVSSMQNPDMQSGRQSRLLTSAAIVRLALSAADFPLAKSYAAVGVRLFQNQAGSNSTDQLARTKPDNLTKINLRDVKDFNALGWRQQNDDPVVSDGSYHLPHEMLCLVAALVTQIRSADQENHPEWTGIRQREIHRVTLPASRRSAMPPRAWGSAGGP